MLGWVSNTPPDPMFDDMTSAAVTEARRTAARGQVVDVDLRIPNGEGHVELSMSAAPVRGPKGEIIEVVLVLADVSERYQLQEKVSQAQRLESLGRLAGGVAHDFNNLLTVILGYSEIILGRLDDDDPIRSQVDAIRRAGEQAGQLTDHLLTLSRRRVTEPVVLDTNEVVTSFGGVLGRLVGPNIDVNVAMAGEELLIEVDRGQLEQVLLNLAVNARDAMPNGGSVTVETRSIVLDGGHEALHAGSHVMIAVTDTGVGMSPSTLERIFEPFFTTKPPGSGTGLGLAIVREIVEQNRGHLAVKSAPGSGTILRVYLPAAVPTLGMPEAS
jgi:signal transduction histidine kinase